jgi:hypothetical protein
MKKLFWLGVCAIIGAIGAYYAQPYASHNSDIVLIIVTVFSVFAGFLIAVITIIGDPIMIREGSWRVAEVGHDTMRSRLFSHIGLFILYLVTISALFIGVIIEKACPHSAVKVIVEWLYLFFGITSFLLTFALPASLWNMQKARYEAEIERRRSQSGISS